MGHGSVVVNKVLPMHDKAHWSVHCWWLLSPHNDRVECNRGCMAHRAYNICYLAFYQKKFADPSFRPVSLSLRGKSCLFFPPMYSSNSLLHHLSNLGAHISHLDDHNNVLPPSFTYHQSGTIKTHIWLLYCWETIPHGSLTHRHILQAGSLTVFVSIFSRTFV